MPSLDTLPAEIRLNIYDMLTPRSAFYRLGYSKTHHEERDSVALRARKESYRGDIENIPNVSHCMALPRVCRLFDVEYTSTFYRRATFAMDNNEESMELGRKLFENLRPATARLLPRVIIFYHCWQLERQGRGSAPSYGVRFSLRELEGYQRARDGFCAAADRANLKLLRLVLSCGTTMEVDHFSSLRRATWLRPFLCMSNVQELQLRFGTFKFNEWGHGHRAFHELLDELNGSGISAHAVGYRYDPSEPPPRKRATAPVRRRSLSPNPGGTVDRQT